MKNLNPKSRCVSHHLIRSYIRPLLKRPHLLLLAIIIISMASCKKDDIKPSHPDPAGKLIDCRGCGGTWDIDDPKGY